MRTCSTLLQLAGFLVGIFGVIGGAITFISPTYSVGTYGSISYSSPNSGGGIVLIASSIISWLVLYGLGASLDALADIHDDTRRSANASERNLLANERTAEALERMAIQRRRAQPQQVSSEIPPPPPKNTVLRQLGERADKP